MRKDMGRIGEKGGQTWVRKEICSLRRMGGELRVASVRGWC